MLLRTVLHIRPIDMQYVIDYDPHINNPTIHLFLAIQINLSDGIVL